MPNCGPAQAIRIQVAVDPFFTLVAHGVLRPGATSGLRILVHPATIPAAEMLRLLDGERSELDPLGMSAELILSTVPYLSLTSELGNDAGRSATAQAALAAVQAVIRVLLSGKGN